ncbi:MAG: PHP domain-containing protein [Candidatus Pacearchaeota archaeon]|nr:PHP domain-containing protein [Candidatus Pacearchaeota archaeon]
MKKTIRIDLHVHSCYSYDAFCSPLSLIKAAKKKGLDGIALTDHGTCEGWKEAKKAARKLKMYLILGEEVKCKEGLDILGLWLKREISSRNMEDILEEIHRQRGVAVLAHPTITEVAKKYLKKFDAIEIFNARRYNKNSEEFAKKIKLPFTAGSDAHSHLEVGNAWTGAKAKNLTEFRKKLLKRDVIFFCKKTPVFFRLTSSIAKFRFF